MTDFEFRGLLDLVMSSDPWPVQYSPDPDDHSGLSGEHAVKTLLDREARRRGLDSWVDAYHGFTISFPRSDQDRLDKGCPDPRECPEKTTAIRKK